jgi:ATP-binding cassette subfamily F protein 3
VSRNSDTDNSAAARKERKRLEAEQRQRLKPLRQALGKVEKTMETLQQRKAELETRLADPELYNETQKETLKTLLQEKGTLDNDLATAEEEWLNLSEELEQHSAN